MSELRSTSIRILSSYIRLGSTLLVGIILAPTLLKWLGTDGFGIVQLVLMSVGLPAVFQDIMRQSMVRPLGLAYHKDEKSDFTRVYMSSYLVSCGAAVMAAVGFVVLIALVPYLKIPTELDRSVQWMIVAEGLFTIVLTASAPISNMLIVSERFVLQNTILLFLRLCTLISALILIFTGPYEELGAALVRFSFLTVGLKIFILLISNLWLMYAMPELRLRPHLIQVQRAKRILRTAGGITLTTLSVNVQSFVSVFIMNLGFGLLGNTVFGIARQLSAYIQMATVGMTFGLDAVSARIATTKSNDTLVQLAFYTTRLQAVIAIPAGVFIFLFAGPILELWIGGQLDSPETNLPYAVALTKILAIGLMATGIGDGWIRLLYGAGFLRQYIVPLVSAGIANPILALLLYYVLPEPIRYWCVAIAYSAVFVTIYGLIMPHLLVKLIGIKYSVLLKTISLTLLCAVGAGSFTKVAVSFFDETGIVSLLVTVSTFGILYAIFAWMVLINSQERRMIIQLLRHKTPFVKASTAHISLHEMQQEGLEEITETHDSF
jgi:O-antigen/teichoic acid export membrane protein